LKTVIEDLDPSSPLDSALSTSYAYDLRGNLDHTTLPNGVITDYVFDNLNRLDKMTDFAPDPTPNDLSNNAKLAEYDYTVRADGKRTAATETFWLDSNNDGTPEPHTDQFTWTYDNAGRLVDEVLNRFDNSLDQTERFVYDLVGNRLSFNTDQGNNGSVDEAISYVVDANDRLKTESLDTGNNGSVDQTTTYAYDHTQQASKAVTDSLNSQLSTLNFSYDLQGRMSQVVTETYSGGLISRRERVRYDYDASGIRVSSLLEVDADANGSYESSTRTEYLVDHQNFTGYEQVIKETVYNGSGQITKTIEYLFGHDEIAQTVTEFDGNGIVTNTVTHIFGHDGHGSVRVLFDVAATIAQLFALDAYGQLLAIHNGTAQFVSASAADALTTILQNGEYFDAVINQLYLRARWYDPRIGRFITVDPIFGNLNDPLSLHKYADASADPANRIDPSGMGDIQVHFWSVYIILRNRGYSASDANDLAYYSQLPDQVPEFDAVVARLGGGAPGGFDRLVFEVLHSLHGGDAKTRQGKLGQVGNRKWDEWNTWQRGFFLHAYADSFFHVRKSDDGKSYVAYNWDEHGHGSIGQQHLPDTYAANRRGGEQFLRAFAQFHNIADQAELLQQEIFRGIRRTMGTDPILFGTTVANRNS
jgi:RHS repeat-associated protein